MQYPELYKSLNLTTRVSDFVIGAILIHGFIGKVLLIAYASATINDSQQNYFVIEKKTLSIVLLIVHAVHAILLTLLFRTQI